MRIDIWCDVTCPWCYLALRHLRSALVSLPFADEVSIELHAFFLDPDLSESVDVGAMEYLTSNRSMTSAEAQEVVDRLTEIGKEEGVSFDFNDLIVAPTVNAHKVIAAAHDQDCEMGRQMGPNTGHLRVANAIDYWHFEKGQDISQPDILEECAQEAGLEPSMVPDVIVSESYSQKICEDYQKAFELGIESVPTMIIDERFVIQGSRDVKSLTGILTAAWEYGTFDPDRPSQD